MAQQNAAPFTSEVGGCFREVLWKEKRAARMAYAPPSHTGTVLKPVARTSTGAVTIPAHCELSLLRRPCQVIIPGPPFAGTAHPKVNIPKDKNPRL